MSTKRLLTNSSSNLLVMFLKIAITLVMTPIFVHNLGAYDYGVWEITLSVIGYMGILDLGMLPTMARFAAHHRARAEEEQLFQTFASCVVFMGAIGLLLGTVFLGWALFFPQTLAEPGQETTRYTIFLLIIGAQILVTFPGYVATSFLEGFQHYTAKNNIVLVNTLISSAITIAFITPENALILVAALNAIGTIIKHLYYFYLLRKERYGNVYFRARDFYWPKLQELLRFGSKSFIQGASYRIANFSDNLVIGAFLGPAQVMLFSLPNAIVRNIRMVVANATQVFLPFFTELNAKGDHEGLKRYYINASRYVTSVVIWISAVTLVTGADFISVWIDPKIGAQSDGVLYVLLAYTSITLLNPFYNRYLTAIGKHGLFAYWEPPMALANIAISLSLVHWLGLIGVALGTLIPNVVIHVVYLRESMRHLGVPVGQFLWSSLGPNLLPAALTMAFLIGFEWQWPLTGWWPLLTAMASGSLLYLLLYLGIGAPADGRALWQWLQRRRRI